MYVHCRSTQFYKKNTINTRVFFSIIQKSLSFLHFQADDTYSLANSQVPLSNGHNVEADELPERGNWTGRFDFLLSLLGWVLMRLLKCIFFNVLFIVIRWDSETCGVFHTFATIMEEVICYAYKSLHYHFVQLFICLRKCSRFF